MSKSLPSYARTIRSVPTADGVLPTGTLIRPEAKAKAKASKAKVSKSPKSPKSPKVVKNRALRAAGGIQRATGGHVRGRPALSPAGSIQMSPIRVPPDLYERALSASLAAGLSMSAWVRQLVERAS